MSRFHPRTPRTAIGFAAIALSAATFGLAVVAPATMDAERPDARILTAAPTMPHVDTAIPRLRIEVVGVRAPEVAASQDRGGTDRNAPQS